MTHQYYSLRNARKSEIKRLSLEETLSLFIRVYDQFQKDGYFDEAFGFDCVDVGHIAGKIKDIQLELALSVRKENLWPMKNSSWLYEEDDLFDMIEFLFQQVSKPVSGEEHSYNNCGMHWETFDQIEGRILYRTRVNAVLDRYEKRFELSPDGEVLQSVEVGFEPIFDAAVPSKDQNVVDRVGSAVRRYRRHGSSLDDRRQAVGDLIDVLEYLRPQLKTILKKKDESDLFNIANNFGLRHHNELQKTDYDASLWLSWMFYFYLATVHVVLRKVG